MIPKDFTGDVCKWAEAVNCDTYWSAWSTIATGLAVVAAFLAILVTAVASQRQRRIEAMAKREAIREVCSAADQILAYHEVAIALGKGAFPYSPAQNSWRRIMENTATLRDVLHLLEKRSELTDGAIYVAVAVQRIAAPLIEIATKPDAEGDWARRVAVLEALNPLAELVATRAAAVRRHAGLEASTSALAIREKYGPMIAEMARCLATQEVPNLPNVFADRY
jgi:hypothetical protein